GRNAELAQQCRLFLGGGLLTPERLCLHQTRHAEVARIVFRQPLGIGQRQCVTQPQRLRIAAHLHHLPGIRASRAHAQAAKRSSPCWARSDSTQAPCRVCTQRSVRRAKRSTGVLRNVPVRGTSSSWHTGRSSISRTDCRASCPASQSNRVAAVCRVWYVLTPTTSSTRQSVFPGYVRVPRPSIC